VALAGTVQKFEDLPTSPSVGSIYKIIGGTETSFVPYYVVWTSDSVWDETVAPDLQNRLDPLTMPHALVRLEDGTFRFAPFQWGERLVGDDVSNPKPGFVDRRINGAFVNQNRLAFLYDENTIMSGAGDFGQFFRLTVLDYLDSDPLDIAATTSKVSILRDAVPFNDGVMLFADQTQFALSNGEAGLSPTSLAIRPVTHYEVSKLASPVTLGSEVYFASDKSGHSAVFEYTRSGDSDVTTAANITSHVPRYIPPGVHKLIPAGDLNALFLLTDGDPSALYVYQVYWADAQTKAQSAWHRWSLSSEDTILSGSYSAGVLSLVLSRPSGVFLERLQLGTGGTGDIPDRYPYLDRRQSLEGVYDDETDRTTFTLPEPIEEPDRFWLVRSADYPGSTAEAPLPPSGYEWESETVVTVPGDASAGPVWGGYVYQSRWRPSQPYIRRQDGTAIISGRLQLRTLKMSFRNTASFQAVVHPYGENMTDPMRFTFSGLVVGTGALNERPKANGDVALVVSANAETAVVDIINEDPFGFAFQSAEWEGFFWSRARP
jgi:hypothetical protein